jgi:SAM-dependent methyltransferase
MTDSSILLFLRTLPARILNRIVPRLRIIIDRERRLGNFDLSCTGYDATLIKEEVSRRYVLDYPGEALSFLDVGARDGALTYLMGIHRNFDFDQALYQRNMALFGAKYTYYGMDLHPGPDSRVLSGDACSPDYCDRHPEFIEKFDVIYSNNVFEHFNRPWIAAANLTKLLKTGGIVITIVPFSQRYHEDPGDYYRYSHKGIEFLFQSAGQFEVLESGYDLCGRRNNWQGSGEVSDIVPVDHFGAWRETWYVVSVLRKLA